MRVTFEHVQDGKRFALNSTIDFSEEEKAIIQQRGLADKCLAFGTAAPIGSGIEAGGLSSAGIQTATRILVVLGVVSIPFSAAKMLPELFPFLFFILAAITFVIRKQ